MGVVEESRFGGLDLGLWGKYCKRHGVIYPVLFHMLDVAAVAGELWDRLLVVSQRALIASGLGLTEAEARCVVMFIAGLHDVGKVSRFQACEPVPWARVGDGLRADTNRWRLMRHERASMHVLVGLLAELGYGLRGDAGPAVRMAQIAGGHHGRFLQVDVHGAASRGRVQVELGGRLWQQERRRYVAQLQYLTGAHAVPDRVSAPAAVLMTGLVMVADRLASQQRVWLPRALMPAYGAAEHFAWARWMAEGVVAQSRLARVELPPRPFTAAHVGLRWPNALQVSVLEDLAQAAGARGTGIMVIADGTGAGKTVTAYEASRIFNSACGTRGISYLQPTTATADATYASLAAYIAAHRPTPAALTLVHNHSWCNAAYSDEMLAPGDASTCTSDDPHWDEDVGDGEELYSGSGDGQGERRWLPDGWVRGWDRALLAQFTVATVDQALMTVLPVRHNALRMLAFSGRCVVVDEVHALSPYSRRILKRLLHWRGALGTPVILLSATLPGQVARELLHAYLTGCGHPRHELLSRDFTVPYPGWLYAEAATARTTVIDDTRRQEHVAAQQRALRVRLRPVYDRRLGRQPRRVKAGERLARIAAAISPVAQHGGCGVVVCATVADAQDTYRYLKRALSWPDGTDELRLLHARFPGHHLEKALDRTREQLGPTGPRPDRLVVVTTSLLELSLNIDADVMVSDLASLARLIQRAGRLWRFEHAWQQDRPPGVQQRPAWIRARGAHLTVLDPVDAGRCTELPDAWHGTDSPYLQHATAHLLKQPDHRCLNLPGQAHQLIELIHQSGRPATWSPHLAALYEQQQAADRTEEHASTVHLVPPHDRIASLADLHRQQLTAATAATRPNDRPRRVLAVHHHPDRSPTLDRAGHILLPQGPRLRPSEIRTVLQHTVPVPTTWVADRNVRHQAPDAWQQHPLLADLVLLPQEAQQPQALQLGRHQLQMDDELGLIHDELPTTAS
ncbi:CRISPR-associated helicase Cas3' [Streptomyces sp. NPDC047085]|uniref:CRISPR-associated helicase Cas3' n=1 Tax=Streptomyces sp. NPDC047085 TaxID=3155140 RepID=UPI00340E3813